MAAEPSSDARLHRVTRWARDRFMRWVTKPITRNEVIGFGTLWLAVYVLIEVKTHG